MNALARAIDRARWFTPEEAWEILHEQTFERVGLTLTTSRRFREHGKRAFELGRALERERQNPPTPPVRKQHLTVIHSAR